jgi:hypothetical protein
MIDIKHKMQHYNIHVSVMGGRHSETIRQQVEEFIEANFKCKIDDVEVSAVPVKHSPAVSERREKIKKLLDICLNCKYAVTLSGRLATCSSDGWVTTPPEAANSQVKNACCGVRYWLENMIKNRGESCPIGKWDGVG